MGDPCWQAAWLDGGSHGPWWLEVLVRPQLCHNGREASCRHCAHERLWHFHQWDSRWWFSHTLSPHFRIGHRYSTTFGSCRLCQWSSSSIFVPLWPQPSALHGSHTRLHPDITMSSAFPSYTALNWDSSICNKWNHMFSRYCQLIITSPECLSGFQRSSLPPQGQRHVQVTAIQDLLWIWKRCLKSLWWVSGISWFRTTKILKLVQGEPKLCSRFLCYLICHRQERLLVILPFTQPGKEKCRSRTAPMDESTSPEVQKHWVLPLPPYEELPHNLQFLPTRFRLVEPLHNF